MFCHVPDTPGLLGMEAAGIEPASRRQQNSKQVALLAANILISHRIGIPPHLVPSRPALEGLTGGTRGSTRSSRSRTRAALSSPVFGAHERSPWEAAARLRDPIWGRGTDSSLGTLCHPCLRSPAVHKRCCSALRICWSEPAEVRSAFPPYQRPMQWKAREVRDLLDSVYRGFPIGQLLFWKKEAPASRISFGPVSVDAPHMTQALWIIDGMQRLVSLIAVLLHPPYNEGPRDDFVLYFEPQEEAFVRPRAKAEPLTHWVPMNIVLDPRALSEWVHRPVPPSVLPRVLNLVDALREYRIPASIIEDSEQGGGCSDGSSAAERAFQATQSLGRCQSLSSKLGAGGALELESSLGATGHSGVWGNLSGSAAMDDGRCDGA